MTPEQIAQLLALNGQGAAPQPPPPGFLAGPPLPTAAENYGGPDAQPNPAVAAADDASHAKAAQLPGAPFPVASGAPYARQVPAATPTPGMPSPQGSPIQPATVPDMARQQNDVITQLMGARPRGMSNIGQWYQTAFDKYQDAEQHDYDVRANALLGHLGEMGRQANDQGRINLERIGLLGTPGQQGRMARENQLAASTVEANGINRQHDAQQASAYNSFVQQRVANGASIQDARREWTESNMPVPAFAGGAGPAASVAGGASAAPPTPQEQSPQSRLEQIYRTVQSRQPGNVPGQPPRINDPNSAITDMVSSLGDSFVSNRAPEVMKFMIDRFGGPAVNAWFTNRTSRVGRNTDQENAIRSVMAGARRHGADVGTSGVNSQSGGILSLLGGILGR